jgi:hypothetical protein
MKKLFVAGPSFERPQALRSSSGVRLHRQMFRTSAPPPNPDRQTEESSSSDDSRHTVHGFARLSAAEQHD